MKAFFALLTLALCAASAAGQAALEVTLLEAENGQPAAYQPLLLRNAALGQEMARTTNDQGRARFEGLSTGGSWELSLASTLNALLGGNPELVLISGRTTTLTLQVGQGDLRLEAVAVSAYERRDLNNSNAEVAGELTLRELTRLPVEGRDITRALYRLPNISLATGFYPEAPVVAINGANSLFTQYLIDGMDNNENFLGGMRFAMPLGFTRHISALTNNFSAEYGLSSNGVINITSQSGTNTWTGEVFYLTRPGELLTPLRPSPSAT
jgi:hypothetical protein